MQSKEELEDPTKHVDRPSLVSETFKAEIQSGTSLLHGLPGHDMSKVTTDLQ